MSDACVLLITWKFTHSRPTDFSLGAMQRLQQLSFASGVRRVSEGNTQSSSPGLPDSALHRLIAACRQTPRYWLSDPTAAWEHPAVEDSSIVVPARSRWGWPCSAAGSSPRPRPPSALGASFRSLHEKVTTWSGGIARYWRANPPRVAP